MNLKRNWLLIIHAIEMNHVILFSFSMLVLVCLFFRAASFIVTGSRVSPLTSRPIYLCQATALPARRRRTTRQSHKPDENVNPHDVIVKVTMLS